MLRMKVVGPGCPNCEKLEKLCQEVVIENDLEAQVEKVTDVSKFAELGVMLTPALLVNDKLVVSGKIPVKSTLAHWLMETSKSA